MENVIFTAEENSFILEAEGKKLRVSYAEHTDDYKYSMDFCKENGGGDETVENWRLIAKCRAAINKELAALGKDLINGQYWTTELSWRSGECAFVVSTIGGTVRDDGYLYSNYNARAVSAL